MIILGAGMSGLLAAQYFRSLSPTVIEKQKSLPNNHKALLRFRSEAVSELTGIRFREVGVNKAVWGGYDLRNKATIADMNNYSYKVTGNIRGRSIRNLEPCTRYIAPDDFLTKLSAGLDIKLGVDCENIVRQQAEGYEPKDCIISTIPIATLAEILDYKLPELKSLPIWTITADIDSPDCDIYQTVYMPYDSSQYRASITGNKLILEYMAKPKIVEDQVNYCIRNIFRIPRPVYSNISLHHQEFGKLIERGDRKVKNFIWWATKEYNIYSLGRWGTHRQLLMDDVVNDISIIDNLINTEGYGK
jgi:hypothetical protein